MTDSPSSDQPVLQGRYRIIRTFGTGGMSVVFEAFDQRLNRRVAIKQNGSILSWEDFEREGQLLAQLKHDHLPTVHDYFEEDGKQYLVMEFIDGRNLDEQLAERKKFLFDEIAAWVDQILDAMDYLHRQDIPIIHRDIKPKNIIPSDKGAVLVDFGISKETEHTRLETSGTERYAPLEQLHIIPGGTTPASDLYSLSATTYQLLTGVLPKKASSRWDAINEDDNDPLKPAHIREPSVQEEISRVITKGLSLEPRDRYQSAAEMRAAFKHADKTKVAVDIQRAPPKVLRDKRKFWPVVALVLVALLAVLVLPNLAGRVFRTASELTPTATTVAPPTRIAEATSGIARNTTTHTAVPSETPTTQPPSIAHATTPSPEAPTPPPPPTCDLTIAISASLTGDQYARGIAISNTLELALMDKLQALEDVGLAVCIERYDDQGLETIGRENALKIVEEERNICVVGLNRSGILGAALPIYNDWGMPANSVGATNVQLTSAISNSHRVLLRVVGRDDVQAQVAVDFIRTDLPHLHDELPPKKRVHIIHDSSAYGNGLAEEFKRYAEEYPNDIEVVDVFKYDPSKIQDIANVVKADQVDIVYMAGYHYQTGRMFAAIRKTIQNGGGKQPILIGTDGADNASIVDDPAVRDAITGMYYTTVAMPKEEYENTNNPAAQELATRYKEVYGETEPSFLAESYDAAGLCLEALLRARAKNPTIPVTRAAVLAELQAFDGTKADRIYHGVSGNYAFTKWGDPQEAKYYIREVPDDVIGPKWSSNPVIMSVSKRPQ